MPACGPTSQPIWGYEMRSSVLNDLFLRPDYDGSRVTVAFTAPEGCSDSRWAILDGERVVVEGVVPAVAGAESSFEANLPGFIPWNVHSPHLYTLALDLVIDGRERPERHDFGMRKIHVAQGGLYVNNQRFYVRGYIRGREAHDHPNLENLPLEEYYAKNIRMAKRYGFNFVRFHSQIPPEECFRAADRLGIFIHIEMRKYYGRYQKERAVMEEGRLLDEQEWTEMVHHLRNHPSLMLYCMGNEIDHPGRNPRCQFFYDLTRKLDPTRLFLDTCSRGEFDRESVDLDVQHMSYFYPFGHSYHMFEDTQNWLIYGSAKGLQMVEQSDAADHSAKIMRHIPVRRPVLAHEVSHFAALRDVDRLDQQFRRAGAPKPWWIDELKKLIRLKGHEDTYPRLLEASQRFQMLSWKLAMEAARRSPILAGYHFLQLSDTDRYENCNGVIDCFDEPKGVDAEEFLKFNSDTVLLADLPRRCFFEGEEITVPVVLSHFSPEIGGAGDLSFSLASRNSGAVGISGGMADFDLSERGRRDLCRLRVVLPRVERPEALVLSLELRARETGRTVTNSWNLWLFPDRPAELPEMKAAVVLDEVHIAARYPQIERSAAADTPEKLLIVNRFSDAVFAHLANGGDVLLLYRVPITRDRKKRAPREEYYLPTTWERFKGVVWDRGHNCGAFMRESAALSDFPHDGFLDLQFHSLIDDCDKIVLDDFPVPVEPIMEGVDKASRDRFDVFTYGLSELQPAYTMRKFAYLFELRVGRGRLFVSGFNFTGLNRGDPAASAMFESILRYVTSDAFRPTASIGVEDLKRYLREKGAAPIIKERRMTQYWQLDEEPLESKRYWQESLEYLDEKPLTEDAWLKESQEAKLAESDDE